MCIFFNNNGLLIIFNNNLPFRDFDGMAHFSSNVTQPSFFKNSHIYDELLLIIWFQHCSVFAWKHSIKVTVTYNRKSWPWSSLNVICFFICSCWFLPHLCIFICVTLNTPALQRSVLLSPIDLGKTVSPFTEVVQGERKRIVLSSTTLSVNKCFLTSALNVSTL